MYRNGRKYAFVTKTAVSVPRAKVRGRWWVRAVDKAGNIGPKGGTLVVR